MQVHPHLVFELLAYTVGFQLFRSLRRREGDPVADPLTRAWTMAAGVVGAVAGAKALFLFEDPAATWAHLADPARLFGGRSIVGALRGGLVGVELAKKVLRVEVATGDVYVLPLCVGIALGRVGCHLTGVADGTHGVQTSLPWAMDLGDGVGRHPAALYEIGVLAVLGATVGRWRPATPGDRFKVFMVAYLTWRLGIEALKTQPFPYLGLSAIQVACALGLLYYAALFWRRRTSIAR